MCCFHSRHASTGFVILMFAWRYHIENQCLLKPTHSKRQSSNNRLQLHTHLLQQYNHALASVRQQCCLSGDDKYMVPIVDVSWIKQCAFFFKMANKDRSDFPDDEMRKPTDGAQYTGVVTKSNMTLKLIIREVQDLRDRIVEMEQIRGQKFAVTKVRLLMTTLEQEILSNYFDTRFESHHQKWAESYPDRPGNSTVDDANKRTQQRTQAEQYLRLQSAQNGCHLDRTDKGTSSSTGSLIKVSGDRLYGGELTEQTKKRCQRTAAHTNKTSNPGINESTQTAGRNHVALCKPDDRDEIPRKDHSNHSNSATQSAAVPAQTFTSPDTEDAPRSSTNSPARDGSYKTKVRINLQSPKFLAQASEKQTIIDSKKSPVLKSALKKPRQRTCPKKISDAAKRMVRFHLQIEEPQFEGNGLSRLESALKCSSMLELFLLFSIHIWIQHAFAKYLKGNFWSDSD